MGGAVRGGGSRSDSVGHPDFLIHPAPLILLWILPDLSYGRRTEYNPG